MTILLLEDDHLQADWIRSVLEKELGAEVRVVRTEAEFRQLLPELSANPPTFAILDVIVRWTDPAPNIPEPPQDARDGPARAGIRCARLLREHCPMVPFMLYTVLEAADLREDISALDSSAIHLSKESSPKSLLDRIRSLKKGR